GQLRDSPFPHRDRQLRVQAFHFRFDGRNGGGLGDLPPCRFGHALLTDSLVALRLNGYQPLEQAGQLVPPFFGAARGERLREGGNSGFPLLNERGEPLAVSNQTQPRLELSLISS